MFKRYVCVRQHDQSDCGAAALATVARHHGRYIGVQQMRQLAGTDSVGTNLLGLVQAAERLAFAAHPVKGSYDALGGISLPAIAHTRNAEGLGHFVVLHRVTPKAVIMADPGRGVHKLDRKSFCDIWTGYLLLLEPRQVPCSSDTKTDSHRRHSLPPQAGPWRRFLHLLSAHRSVLVETCFCAMLMTALGLTTSLFIQHLVDSILAQGLGSLLNAMGLGMVLIVLFKTLFGVLRGYLLAHVGRRVDLSLISAYARHVVHLPMNFFETRRVGEILSRGNDAAKVREAISGTALTVVLDGLMVIVSVIVLWCYDARLAGVSTAFVPLLLASVWCHHAPVKRRSRQAMERSARFSAHMVEDVAGVETIKAFGVQRLRSLERESHLAELLDTTFGLQKLGISMTSAGTLITGVAGIVILWYGGHRVMAGAMTIGQLMFFYTMLSHLLGPLERLASVNLQIQDALVAVSRLYEVMDLELEPLGESDKAKLTDVQKAIVLQDVSFRYGCREQVLRGVNLKIPARSTVAIVGQSGSGKSTLLKLLTRFYQPDEGKILFDGIDLRDVQIDSLRTGIGVVSQDPFIFNGTIRDNIALGRPQAAMDQIIQAARAAGLDRYVTGLPLRYETVIGERGANLSGGQRQRLAIARVLLCDPNILLFDEATSHLDTTTERAIQTSLRTVFAGKTVVLVAHRLSTVKQADLIYVMHDGQVIEGGSHRQLMALDGQYAKLWRAQTDAPQTREPDSNTFHRSTEPEPTPCACASLAVSGQVEKD